MVNIGVIGCGQWGPNHIRIFTQLSGSKIFMCADLDEKRLNNIQGLYPHIQVTKDYKDILSNPEVDAVCITAPTNTHYMIAKEALIKQKHVLCEKPLALTVKECGELKELAQRVKKVLMVGHIFLFNQGIVKLKEFIQSGEIGQIYYAYATRTNLGPFRYDVNALWDLAPHDISIFNFLFDSNPVDVSARGQKSLNTSHDDLAFVTMEYPNNIVANIHVSWLDPRKVRQITIVGEKKMVVWDDLDNAGPIKLYDKHVEKTSVFYETYGEFQLLSKEGNVMIPHITVGEPLKAQGQYFIQCIENSANPDLADAQKGMDVVAALSAIQRSMDQKGMSVNVKDAYGVF